MVVVGLRSIISDVLVQKSEAKVAHIRHRTEADIERFETIRKHQWSRDPVLPWDVTQDIPDFVKEENERWEAELMMPDGATYIEIVIVDPNPTPHFRSWFAGVPTKMYQMCRRYCRQKTMFTTRTCGATQRLSRASSVTSKEMR